MNSVYQSIVKTVSMQEPDEIPVVIWGIALWYTNLLGISARDYYTDVEMKLKVKTQLQNAYPETMLMPGFWPDFGVIAEASGMGCEIIWPKDEAPYAKPILNTIHDVLKMKPVNVKESGLFPRILKDYDYMKANIDRRFVDDYGHLEGNVFFLGPLETAALVRGYSNFLFDMVKSPQLVHKLLRIVTDTLLEWLKVYEKHQGVKFHRFMLADHFPTQVSPAHFQEFCLPYISEIFQEYPYAMKLYHNEGNVAHVVDGIGKLGCDIFHYGMDAKKAKDAIGDKVTLMGNLDTIKTLLYGTPDSIRKTVQELASIVAPGGGFILSPLGAFGDKTPEENIRAMIDAVRNGGGFNEI